MKVVHVHRISGIGGSERHLLALLPALAARGLEVAFVGLDVDRDAAEPFYRELASANVRAERIAAPRDLDALLALRLGRVLRRLAPDVVHTHLVHADVYGALLAPRRSLVVSTKHNDDPFRAGPFRFAERTLTRRAAAVVAITDALRAFTVERVGLPAEKVTTVHYGLDTPPPPWRGGDVPRDGRRLLLGVGRLVEQKGYDVALRALPVVRAAAPDVRLALVGDGPLRPELERLARELGVADDVLLPGRSGDVAAWMREAEVFVHPARWEGFGLVVLEAMLSGLPVVAAEVSALPELIEHGQSGLLVPPDDPQALAEAVTELLRDPLRRRALSEGARERARERFSVSRMADATAALYERLAAARSASAHW